MSEPLAYFLTWTCYGTWVHGDSRGSVDNAHNVPHTPFLPVDHRWESVARERLRGEPFRLTPQARQIVSDAITAHCGHRRWDLHALNVRSNHVHAVVTAPGVIPERVLSEFKAWSTRRLREATVAAATQPIWTAHGSTRYLWKESAAYAAIEYVLERQERRKE